MNERVTLSELQLMIRDSLYLAMPGMYWVVAEISEIKENYSGHCYLELIEKQADEKNIRARVRAIIWCKRYGTLNAFFQNITGERLREGLKVLVKVQLEYHEIYGLSLNICDIDPAFTLGELALKRQRIIRQLEDEGVFSMNKELELPVTAQKIAVISSSSAAGYTDFMKHLTSNEYGFIFYTKLFESPMQGIETEEGIINALDRIAVHQDKFDAAIIIRGGGSQTDLSWFDNYNIAYHITQFPLPVLTGIGHEKDMTVTDMVAFEALKTPTAVADYIISLSLETASRLTGMADEIKLLVNSLLEKDIKILETARIRLFPMSQMLLSKIREHLAEKRLKLVNYYNRSILSRKYFLDQARQLLATGSEKLIQKRKNEILNLGKNIDLLSPENVLSRGYTITYFNGKIHKSSAGLISGNVIQTRFSDGVVSSKVTGEEEDLTPFPPLPE